MDNIVRLYSLLSRNERRSAIFVLLFLILSTLFEVVGIVSVAPFLSVLANPDIIHQTAILHDIYTDLEFTSETAFLQFLGMLTFIMIVCAAFMRGLSLYVRTRFVQMRRHTIGMRLLESYLRQPYEFFMQRHSSQLTKNILSEVDNILDFSLKPVEQILANSLVLIGIVVVLLLIDPLVVLGMGVALGLTYGTLYLSVRHYLQRLGHERVQHNNVRFQSVAEAIEGIKEIKMLNREQAALQRFSTPSQHNSASVSTITILGEIPRYAIEAIAFGGILLASIFLLGRYGDVEGGGLETVIPLLGIYALAGYRMLPAIQAIYQALAHYRYSGEFLNQIIADLPQLEALPAIPHKNPPTLHLKHDIRLENVHYHYPNETTGGLQEINLTIPRGHIIGIVGGTGAGKSTLVNVFLGLLTPSQGTIRIDGTHITDENRRAWTTSIGYVPQDIFLCDASVMENIAFGFEQEAIDKDKVIHAARLAHIDQFIEGLPDGYYTTVGERGVRISGGQKQRIGIARALYQNPEIIVFDEATSALDNATEAEVMRAINSLSKTKTILLIAHRVSTLKHCDSIYMMDKGKIVDKVTYQELNS